MATEQPGTEERLARAAGRLGDLAHELVVGAQAAGREAAALRVALGDADGDGAADLDAARLVAIELADAGRDRAEVERHLRVSFPGAGLEGVLDDVFGPARQAG